MAKKSNPKDDVFSRTPPETIVEVFRFHNDSVRMKKMTFREFIEMQKQKGVRYQAFQVGICSIPTDNNADQQNDNLLF